MDVKNSEAQKCANTLGLLSNKSAKGNIDMNIVANSDLNFHGVSLTPVGSVSGVWLTSSDIAKALGYASSKSVSTIYSRNSDEFTSSMSMVIKMKTIAINNNLREKSVRVFSLRGCHLIAMFATTDKAKEFRRWVLDILDRQIEQLPLPASNHLINNLELICRTWDEAKEQITVFDPKMAQHLNGTMSMFWMYTMSMKGKGNKKGGVKNNQRYLQ